MNEFATIYTQRIKNVKCPPDCMLELRDSLGKPVQVS